MDFYEARIIQDDGSVWAGNFGPTKEEAVEAANTAVCGNILHPSPTKSLRIEVFECRLVDTIELNP